MCKDLPIDEVGLEITPRKDLLAELGVRTDHQQLIQQSGNTLRKKVTELLAV